MIRSSLDSVCSYVNAIIVLDGPFVYTPRDSLKSTDGTVEIVEEFHRKNNKLIYFSESAALSEKHKREFFFNQFGSGIRLFIIDGDEVCVGDVKKGLAKVRENKAEPLFWVKVETEGWKPRIITNKKGLHYGENHWTILDGEDRLVTDTVLFPPMTPSNTIDEFRILNLYELRSKMRDELRIQYRESMRVQGWREPG